MSRQLLVSLEGPRLPRPDAPRERPAPRPFHRRGFRWPWEVYDLYAAPVVVVEGEEEDGTLDPLVARILKNRVLAFERPAPSYRLRPVNPPPRLAPMLRNRTLGSAADDWAQAKDAVQQIRKQRAYIIDQYFNHGHYGGWSEAQLNAALRDLQAQEDSWAAKAKATEQAAYQEQHDRTMAQTGGGPSIFNILSQPIPTRPGPAPVVVKRDAFQGILDSILGVPESALPPQAPVKDTRELAALLAYARGTLRAENGSLNGFFGDVGNFFGRIGSGIASGFTPVFKPIFKIAEDPKRAFLAVSTLGVSEAGMALARNAPSGLKPFLAVGMSPATSMSLTAGERKRYFNLTDSESALAGRLNKAMIATTLAAPVLVTGNPATIAAWSQQMAQMIRNAPDGNYVGREGDQVYSFSKAGDQVSASQYAASQINEASAIPDGQLIPSGGGSQLRAYDKEPAPAPVQVQYEGPSGAVVLAALTVGGLFLYSQSRSGKRQRKSARR